MSLVSSPVPTPRRSARIAALRGSTTTNTTTHEPFSEPLRMMAFAAFLVIMMYVSLLR
jgi:hypothetical protein